jgi:hypothetical protein
VNDADTARRVASYVDRLLRGANPADPPVEQPTKFDLVINLKTAKALDPAIPPSLLQRGGSGDRVTASPELGNSYTPAKTTTTCGPQIQCALGGRDVVA